MKQKRRPQRSPSLYSFIGLLLVQRDTSLHAIDALHERGNGLDIGIGRLGAKALEEVQQFGGIRHKLHVLSVNLGSDGNGLDASDGQHEFRILDGPCALGCSAIQRSGIGTVLFEGHREGAGLDTISGQILLQLVLQLVGSDL